MTQINHSIPQNSAYVEDVIRKYNLPTRAANVLRNIVPTIWNAADLLALQLDRVLQEPNAGRVTVRQIGILQNETRKGMAEPPTQIDIFMAKFDELEEKLHNIHEALIDLQRK